MWNEGWGGGTEVRVGGSGWEWGGGLGHAWGMVMVKWVELGGGR